MRTNSETSAGILQLVIKEASSAPDKSDFKFMFVFIPERPLKVNKYLSFVLSLRGAQRRGNLQAHEF